MPRHPALQTTRHPRLHHRFAAGKCSGRRGNFTCSVSACLQLRQTLEFFNSPDPASASLKRGDKRPGTVGLVVETWNEVDVNDDRRSSQCPANRSKFSWQVPHFGFIFHLWRCCGSRGSFSRADCKHPQIQTFGGSHSTVLGGRFLLLSRRCSIFTGLRALQMILQRRIVTQFA